MKPKLVSAFIAGAFAVGAAGASADALWDQHKQAELSTMLGLGNPNAPARGEAIAKSGTGSVVTAAADASAHQQALDLIIGAGNPNAPARGIAIAMSGSTQPAALPNGVTRAKDLDHMISAGNPNAPDRGIAIARSGQTFQG